MNTIPTAADAAGAPKPVALASMEDVQALEAVFASSTHADSPASAAPKSWLSPAVQGMILLNISAALFGSNQVLPSLP